jgi:hypothetical protein
MSEDSFVRLTEAAPGSPKYLHELTIYPKGKHND